MAWVATENFNSYTNGDLNTQGGAENGWTGAWSGSANFDVQGGTTFEGAKAVEDATSGAATIDRTLSVTTTSGIIHFAVRRSDKTSGTLGIVLRDSVAGDVWNVTLGTADIQLNGSSSVTLVSGYNTGQWYEIHVSYNTGTNLAKARVDNGAWSSTVGEANSSTGINTFRAEAQGAFSGTFFFDDIKAGNDPITTTSSSTSTSTTSSSTTSSSTTSSSTTTSSTTSSTTSTSSTSSSTSSSSSSSTTTMYGVWAIKPQVEIKPIIPFLEIKRTYRA